jgi:Ni,Fe-hydrogenase I cytochrome b subunit
MAGSRREVEWSGAVLLAFFLLFSPLFWFMGKEEQQREIFSETVKKGRFISSLNY